MAYIEQLEAPVAIPYIEQLEAPVTISYIHQLQAPVAMPYRRQLEDTPPYPTRSCGGYTYQFVEEPSSDLKCLICLCVAKDPLQHGEEGCGKIFCRECIEEYKKNRNNCPNCRGTIVTFKDVRSDRDIQSLKVRCENEQEGCEWVGELRSLGDHEEECGYVKVPCPNDCKVKLVPGTDFDNSDEVEEDENTFQVYRKDLQKHLDEDCSLRDYECPHCEETDKYQFITGQHLDYCSELEIKCPNAPHCTETFLREEEDDHLTTCLYEKVPCKYKDFGCEESRQRIHLGDHENNHQVHLQVTTNTVLSLMAEVSALKEAVSRLESKNNALEKGNTELETNVYKALQQKPSRSGYSWARDREQESLCSRLSFKVPEFARKKQNRLQFYSPPFLTHPRGYKMTIRVDVRGDSWNYISVWAYLMKGDYDDQLEFPFKGTITFELLNQLEDSNHYKRSCTYKGTEEGSKQVMWRDRSHTACGVEEFISHYKLRQSNSHYLKDDCLVFRIYARVPSYKPWLQCTAAPDDTPGECSPRAPDVHYPETFILPRIM